MRLKIDRMFKWSALIIAVALEGQMPAIAPAVAAADQSPSSAVQLAAGDAAIENPASFPGSLVLTDADQKFLDDLERRGIQYFIDEADPTTGLMPDRAKAIGGKSDSDGHDVASTASVGFGLTALCIGEHHGWISRDDAYNRSLRVLTFLRDKAPQSHGYFYHFLNMETGQRVWNCEVSDIDTALLMAGVLTVRQHFPGTELASVADQLYQNVQWSWLTDPDGTLYMGWKPESGFIQSRWDRFSEGPPLIYLLGMGSRMHPLDASVWHAWKREPVMTYAGLTYMLCPPLFTHQYPQAWLDLRGLRDDDADYFRDSQLATLAQRQWCMDELSKKFSTYGPNMWGLTASDSADGYTAWGGPPEQGDIDGSVVPCAAGGSLAFEPRLCLDALEAMKQKYGNQAYLKYGFVDAFNPANAWYNPDVLGIDVGPTVLMAENCRSGFVWKEFMSSPEIAGALKTAGFRPLEPADVSDFTTSLFSTKAADTSANSAR